VPGDLLLLIAGPRLKTQEAMGKFRHLMGTELGLRKEGFRALWVVNFPMLLGYLTVDLLVFFKKTINQSLSLSLSLCLHIMRMFGFSKKTNQSINQPTSQPINQSLSLSLYI